MNRAEVRSYQYEVSARIMALTAADLGVSIPGQTLEDWVGVASRLPAADDLFETAPDCLDATGLAEVLNIQSPGPQFLASATNLLSSSSQALTASTIPNYFRLRSKEGLETSNLFRYQSPENISGNEALWRELSGLIIVGTHLDSFLDCREDARALPQFSAGQLAKGSLVHAVRAARQLRGLTLASFVKACHKLDADKKIAKKVLKPVFGVSQSGL